MPKPRPLPADRLFRALSDTTRLRLLCLLRRGERCVCDLVAAVGAPQPTVSRHLAYLRREGLVAVRRDGAWSHYRLAEPSSPLHILALGCLEAAAAELPEAAGDARRLAAGSASCREADSPKRMRLVRPGKSR